MVTTNLELATRDVKTPRRSNVARRYFSNRSATVALFYLIVLVTTALMAPVIAPHDPAHEDLIHIFASPSGAHLLGTDDLGRDLFSRLVWATRISLGVSGSILVLTVAIATPIGLASGFFGKTIDNVLMRFVDTGLSVPPLVLALAVAGALGTGSVNAVIALTVVFTPGLVRLIRAETLAIMKEDYIDASRVAGTKPIRLICKRILPNVRSSLIVQATILWGQALLAEASLSYLGLGAQAPSASWGNMLRRAYDRALFGHPWQLLVPGGAIALTVLAFFLVGDGLRDALGGPKVVKRRRGEQLGLTSVLRQQSIGRFGRSKGAGKVSKAVDRPLLSIEGLSVAFQVGPAQKRVVEGLDLAIRSREIVGLVGESGSGKTVTAMAVMRLLPTPPARVTEGQVWFGGRDLLQTDFSHIRRVRGRDIAMVFQDPMTSLDPAFTIGYQLIEAQRLHTSLKKREARVHAAELLDLVGIQDSSRRLDEYPHQLSGGMRQRVMLAMALSCKPRLLIADEPTTGLDVTTQAQILELLKKLRDELDMAILFVTHDLGVVAEICDRVAVMYAGQIVEEAPVDSLFRRPRHPYTAGLLRAMPQVNKTRRSRLEVIHGQVPSVDDYAHGCRFQPRCHLAVDACAMAPVPLASSWQEAGAVRCLRADEVPAVLDSGSAS